jgi:hypothetical protein
MDSTPPLAFFCSGVVGGWFPVPVDPMFVAP